MPDQILAYMKGNGPVLPATIAKLTRKSIILASAMLADLVSQGTVKLSSLKVGGGSPVYYLPEHSSKLQDYSGHLNEKDQRAYRLLKKEQVVRDSSLDPLLRVAMRSIKDFAHPLNVTLDNKTELFWKWYLLSNKDAESKIRSLLNLRPSSPSLKKTIAQSPLPAPANRPSPKPSPPPAARSSSNPLHKKPPLKSKKTGASLIHAYFDANNISIESSLKKKGKQHSFKVRIPSPVGQLAYYCVFFDKHKVNERDVSTAYVHGQMENLPVLILTTGNPSKNLLEKLPSYKGLALRRIGDGS